MTLSLGFSPCPNDTFIFDALVNSKFDRNGTSFSVQLADVEQLNKMAIEGVLDVTKLSFGVIPEVSDKYQILDAGSALGRGCGPLLISREYIPADHEVLSQLKIAIPGRKTTANLLLSMAFPGIWQKEEMLFSEVEGAVLSGKVDAGLIIHENRFTYQSKGLKKLIDLGEYWENKTNMPIPLGCIAIRRSLPDKLKKDVSVLIRKSIQSAFDHPEAPMDYVAAHSQEMSKEVMKKHIALYVNDYSLSLGNKGTEAIRLLLETGLKNQLVRKSVEPLFV